MEHLPETTGNFERAVALAAKGYRLLPLRPGTKAAVVRWKQWQTESPERNYCEWFSGTDCGVAILTGTGLVVVDCDSAQIVDLVVAHCGNTPMRCRTPRGGTHLYYRMRGGVRYGNAVKIKDQPIDLRCEGAYAVCPWSVNEAGVPYQWLGEGPRPIAELPLLKVSWLRERGPKRRLQAVTLLDDIDVIQRRARAYLATVEGAISGQRGHSQCMRAAGILVQKFGLSVEAAFPLLAEWNETSCEPPFSEKELLHKLQDAARLRLVRGLKPIE